MRIDPRTELNKEKEKLATVLMLTKKEIEMIRTSAKKNRRTIGSEIACVVETFYKTCVVETFYKNKEKDD